MKPRSLPPLIGATELTARGQEGMFIKPRQFLTRLDGGFVQPAIKCRGREYLRIIYGPEYDHPEQIQKLKSRGLGHKRSLAIREFTLGMEALERFDAKEPLRKTHECVFEVLALESEEVDPRLLTFDRLVVRRLPQAQLT